MRTEAGLILTSLSNKRIFHKYTGHKIPTPEWRILPTVPSDFVTSTGFSNLQASLLFNRGLIDPYQIELFLNPDHRLSHDPFLLPDMDTAISLIHKAISDNEKIAVFGDFDADGLTGTAIMTLALRQLGLDVIPYIPDRVTEGHGLNSFAVGSIRGQGVSTMITVDCGTSSPDEIELASGLGINTIITDHHQTSDTVPEASAIINPYRSISKYPHLGLTGAGLSYKFVEALWESLNKNRPEDLLEIAALGTIADVGPLTDENRYIVKSGLEGLSNTNHLGLKVLIRSLGLTDNKIDVEAVSFGIVPRINASGRVGDVKTSLELLLAESLEEAETLCQELEINNTQRRKLSELATKQAMEQIENSDDESPILFVEHTDWMPGIIGLVANRLSETYHKPVVAMSIRDTVARASVRSIPEFNVFEALEKVQSRLIHYGGHHAAGGFSVPITDLSALKSEMIKNILSTQSQDPKPPIITIDCEISPSLFNSEDFDFIDSLKPFGKDNPEPIMLTRKMRVVDSRLVGRSKNHLKLKLSHENKIWDGIAFKQGNKQPILNEHIDVVYNIGMNDWGGIKKPELKILDLRPTSIR